MIPRSQIGSEPIFTFDDKRVVTCFVFLPTRSNIPETR